MSTLVERVDQQRSATPPVERGIVDDDLGEAQQRPVTPLGHELGVDPEPPALARRRGGARQHRTRWRTPRSDMDHTYLRAAAPVDQNRPRW